MTRVQTGSSVCSPGTQIVSRQTVWHGARLFHASPHLVRERTALLGARRCLLTLVGFAVSGAICVLVSEDNATNRSISHRPAGPGGVSILCATCIGYTPPRQSGSSNRTSLPASISARTIGSGIPPQPKPLSSSLCFNVRSPTRQADNALVSPFTRR